ncbi:MAG TPA: hypothetical protein VM659_04040 [Dongiaceae bacterium]|nr:hypothetical protein [Dongiaceae bacterium]
MPTTLCVMFVALLVGVFANWQLRRPFHRRALPMIPWTGVQFLVAVVAIVMAAHLVSLITGHDFHSRYGY